MSITSKMNWINIKITLFWLKKAIASKILLLKKTKDAHSFSAAKMVNRIDYLLDFCRNRTVLHVGFADYPYTEEKIRNNSFLHLQLKACTKKIIGFDYDKSAIQKYISLTGDKDVFHADLLNPASLQAINKDVEIVLLGEILEHLKNPHQAVENLYNAFSSSTIFLITTPNYTSLQNIAASLHRIELIHPDHYWYFSPVTLSKLFSSEKFEQLEINFGMHFQKDKKINLVLKQFPLLGDCIIAVFKKK